MPLADAIGTQSNYRAVVEYLKLEADELLTCDLDDHRLFRPNYFICLDRRLSAVVLGVRGTMVRLSLLVSCPDNGARGAQSWRDTVTDLTCEYVPWRGGFAHAGMLSAARWFMANVSSQLVQFARKHQMKNIYFTGHSLGGATGALLAIMMEDELAQQQQEAPLNLHCYSFGTPPVLSRDLAKRCMHLVDNFIFGEDAVPRLSYGTVADLQALMVYTAETAVIGDVFKVRARLAWV